jgi:glycosyltransferase involved in cell wall biosynthesis
MLDSDDCLLPRAVEKMYTSHIENPGCGLIYSQFVACHEDLSPRQMGYCAEIPVGETDLDASMVSHFKTFKTRDYLKTSGYDEQIVYAEDKDIIMKMEEVTQLKFVDECLYVYRELPNSQCHGPKESISKQSWERAKENARRRRGQVLDRLLGPNANVPAEELIIRHNSDGSLDQHEPEFSVVMANYNNGKYVGDAIKSVLNQSFKNWELIIVDDGSTDNSLQIIEPYLCDKRIRLIKHEQNKGCPAAEKTAISHVRSKYFGILDSDDCLAHNAIEVIYNEHVSNPDCGFIYAQLQCCDKNLLPFKKGINKAIPPSQTSLDCDISQWRTFKLADYLKTEGLDEDFEYAEDKDVIYKMEEVTKLKFVDKVLYLCRELPDSQCHNQRTSAVGTIVTAKAKINALKRRCSTSAESGSRTFQELFTEAIYTARTKYRDVEHYFVVLRDVLRVLRKAVDEGGQLKYLELPPEFMTWGVEDAVWWMAVDMKFRRLLELIKLIERRVGSVEKPLVSIYMVTYNNDRFIRKAIDSVLAQSCKNFELLVIDDGSTDRTKEVVASAIVDCYGDSRIRYLYKPHKNFASGVNLAIIMAKGKYLVGVDSDDFIEPDYIEKMVAFADKYPDVDYFYPAKLTLIDESGDYTGVDWNYLDFSDNRILPAFLFDKGYGPIPNPGSLKRRSMFSRVGLYEELETVEDFAFLCRNALKICFKRVDEQAKYFYRRSPSSNSFKLEARNRLMSRALNEMVSLYPPEALYPEIASVPADLREKRYYEYLMETFYRHSRGNMVRYGRYYQQHGDHYRQKLLAVEQAGESRACAAALSESEQKNFVELFKQGAEYLKAARSADALACFDEACRVGGDVDNLNYARAVALAQLGRMDDARSACEAELAVQPNHEGVQRLLNKLSEHVNVIN